MKKKSLLSMSLIALASMVWAQTPGYALYGDVPTGYTDLTSNVTASAQGTVTKDADTPLTFTGKGLSGSQYCNTSNYLRLDFNAAQPMSLTSEFALHIFIKKAETATGDVQICLCKNGWNANRIPWLIANSAISSSEYSEVVLKYADRNTSISWNSYGDGNLIGTNVNFEANEMMRICAANGEQFMIDKIFLEATYTEPTPGPGPEPEPDPEFDAPVAVDGTGYLLYGATAPCGYEDLKSSVAYSAKGSLALNDAAGLKITGAGLPGRICETSNYLQMSFSAQQSLTLDENFSLHIVIAKSSTATGDVQVSFCRNGWNSTRIAYTIANSAIGTEPTDIELKYTARNTGNWNSYGESAALGSPATFPAAEILRLCATAGEEFTITGLYLQTSATPCFTPDPSDEEAPTNVTAAVKAGSVSYNEATLTLSAEDESAPITFNIWNADKTVKVATANSASGVAKDVTITGLTPETNYTYYVEAVDNAGNATEQASWVEVSFTTTKMTEKRYYFFRGGDLPENTADLTCVDLRKGQGTNITLGNNATLTEKMYWTKIVTSNSWWSFNQNLSAAQDMSDVNYTEWYLKVKFRTNITNNDFNIRLLEQICWQVNRHNLTFTTDGEWNELTLSLSEALGSHPAFDSFSANKTILQFNSNCTSGLYVDIEYAYLTNNQDAEDGYADHTAPTNFTAVAGTVTSTTAELLLQATDDSGEDVEYVITSGPDTWNVTGASGVQISKTITDLTEASYTFSVVAKDHAGNAVTTPIEVEVTMQAEDVTPPADLTVTKGEVTLHSIELLLQATDENGTNITYDITMDGALLASIVGASEQQISYVANGLEINSVHNFSVVARDLDGNTSAAVELNDVATTSLKTSEFATMVQTMTMYAPNGGGEPDNHKASETEKTTMEIRVVVYKDQILFRQKVLGDGQSVSTGTWDNQMWIWNDAQIARSQEIAAQYRPFDTRVRYTKTPYTLNGSVGDEFYFNMYANSIFGVNGATVSPMQQFIRGYINTPSDDEAAPTLSDVQCKDETGERILTMKAAGNDDIFYLVQVYHHGVLGEEYITLENTLTVPLIAEAGIAYNCYAIDWNGNKSPVYTLNIDGAIFNEAYNNQALAAQLDGQVIDVTLARAMSSSYLNTLCLPFSMSEAQVKQTYGENCRLMTLTSAGIKENDELFLGFSTANQIEAGVPYLIQPDHNVGGLIRLQGVEVSATMRPIVFPEVVEFIGILEPTELQADDHDILFLLANNVLTFPNVTNNLRPMRAYFHLLGSMPLQVRAARIVQHEDVVTDIQAVTNESSADGKYLRDGQVIIVREGVQYNAMGQKIQ